MNESAQPPTPQPLAGVKNVIAVGAGKGGVGKSTVAALLAAGMQRRNLKVALLDGDVYGPSLPKITGTEGAEPTATEDGRIVPPQREGIGIMSMGYLVPDDQAVIWRGPMAQKYITEFLTRGQWGELDCLIVDLPPGTGDIPLTLAQSIPLAGAVVVCTPQDIALSDALRALRMYEKLGVPALGLIENMSYYVCPKCGNRDEIFGHGGVAKAAELLNVPYLGGIPLNIRLRQNGDEGALFDNFTQCEPPIVAALEQITDNLIAELKRRAEDAPEAPTLHIQ